MKHVPASRPCTDNPFLKGVGIRPFGRPQAARRRVAHLAAEGYSAREIGEVEGIKAEHVEELLGDDGFAKLVRAYRVIQTKPLAEQHERLVKQALRLIE